MMEYSSNIAVVVGGFQNQLQTIRENPDPILRAAALAVLPEMRVRVHKNGLDSQGNKIGTYSPGYMKVRTGNFENSKRVTRGAKKGKLKDAGRFTEATIRLDKKTGVFSGEDKVGKPRPRYNRTDGTDVILSLTRQMEQDMTVVPNDAGVGIGYNNPLNLQKAHWCEETYKKQILTQLTTGELELVETTINEFLPEYLNNL